MRDAAAKVGSCCPELAEVILQGGADVHHRLESVQALAFVEAALIRAGLLEMGEGTVSTEQAALQVEKVTCWLNRDVDCELASTSSP